MSDPIPELIRRQRAVDATLAKYRAKAWSWQGGATCVHLARFHLRQLGHKPQPLPRVQSHVGALRALRQHGWATVADMLDAQPGLTRIAPAAMLPGDLAVAPSADGLGAVLVCAGPHKLIGWHDGADGMVVMAVGLDELVGAWRA